MEFIVPEWKDLPKNIGTLVTTRRGGVSHAPFDDGEGGGGLNLGMHVGDQVEDVAQNRALLGKNIPAEPAWLTQVHGVKVVDAATVDNTPEADASYSTQSGTVCVVQTADCLPVLFCDLGGTVVATAHAGWRGLANGVLENTVSEMRKAGAGDIIAWLGPAIGSERFEVGHEVRDIFLAADDSVSNAFKRVADASDKYLADIYLLARHRLASVGVERISGGGLCTMSDERRFYSYRRNARTGRMASLIWIR